jgi:hypothetical protein
MTSTHCQSVALGRIIAPWAVKIAEFFGTIVKIILTIVENVRNSLHELGACCRKARRRLIALRPGLSRPMMPKLKTMGRHARVPSPQPATPRAGSSPSWSRDDAAGYVPLADIGAAPARITDAALSAPRCRGKAHGFRSA